MHGSTTELQKLADTKGFRLKATDKPDRYFLIDTASGMPAHNPDSDTPFFNRTTALQFLLETPDLIHGLGTSHAA